MRLSAGCAIVGLSLALTPITDGFAQTTKPTADAVRHEISRRVGTWITSNSGYRTEDNGEPKEYGTHFIAGLGHVSTTGCLWGQTDGTVSGVYWHFFTGWDPVSQAMIVYQSGQGGMVGIGREQLSPGNESIVDQTFTPLPGSDAQPFRVRHRTTWIAADTMRTESLDWDGSDWTPRRSYVWIRQAGGQSPC